MEQNRRSKRALMFGLSSILWVLMVAAWFAIWMECYADIIQLPFFRRGNWLVVGVYGILLFLISHLYGGYKVGDYRRGDIIFSNLFSMLVVNVITYFQISLMNRDWLPPTPVIAMSLLDFTLIWIWATIVTKAHNKLYPPHKMLVVYGGSSQTQSLLTKMADRPEKYLIQEVINIDQGMDRVLDRVCAFESVLICDVPSGQRNRVLKYCFDKSIRTYMTPKISDILIRGASEVHLFDTPLLISRNTGLRLEQRFLKRAMDLFVSSVALIVSSPFMLVVAAAIKIQDGGPVLFKQQRLTQNGRVFHLYKFRSMIVDAEKKTGAKLASKDDDRITPVGKIIRRFRLDELPQLINVFCGDMSLVGPRPERPELAIKYMEEMEEFSFRLKVKAGLTGYAQVLGKYNTTPYDKLKLDLMYISSYSVLLDLKLLMQTAKILFMIESTEGV